MKIRVMIRAQYIWSGYGVWELYFYKEQQLTGVKTFHNNEESKQWETNPSGQIIIYSPGSYFYSIFLHHYPHLRNPRWHEVSFIKVEEEITPQPHTFQTYLPVSDLQWLSMLWQIVIVIISNVVDVISLS